MGKRLLAILALRVGSLTITMCALRRLGLGDKLEGLVDGLEVASLTRHHELVKVDAQLLCRRAGPCHGRSRGRIRLLLHLHGCRLLALRLAPRRLGPLLALRGGLVGRDASILRGRAHHQVRHRKGLFKADAAHPRKRAHQVVHLQQPIAVVVQALELRARQDRLHPNLCEPVLCVQILARPVACSADEGRNQSASEAIRARTCVEVLARPVVDHLSAPVGGKLERPKGGDLLGEPEQH